MADRRRPAGGVSDGATGIGASELVDWPDFALKALEAVLDALEAVVSALALAASCSGCGALPSAPVAALAEPGAAHQLKQATEHARRVIGRGTPRG